MSKTLYIVGGVAALVALPIIGSVMSTFSTVTSAPSRVINRTLETDNIIYNYEWFHDQCATIVGYEEALASQQAAADLLEDPKAKTRAIQNMAGIKAQRTRAIAQYNANATKTNRSIFQGTTLPDKLDPQTPTTFCN